LFELGVPVGDDFHEVEFDDDKFGVVFDLALVADQLTDGHSDAQEADFWQL
jgi:hypothetical protein